MAKQRPPRAKLDQWLSSRGIEQGKLATLTGMTPTMISRICRGIRRPSPEECRQIAQALGVGEAVLFDPLAGLESDVAAIERLVGWLRGDEGRLLVGRLLRALEA